MTTNRTPGPFARHNRRGIAIVIVLAALVLLALIVVAFLQSVGTERSSSRVYANGTSVKLLSESAVNIVVAEVNAATSGTSLCWASQPGMIRTYDATANAVNYYKLYSDDGMVGSGAFDHTKPTNIVPTNWYNQNGVYVDLNEPVTVNGTNHYPIVDGNKNDLTATVGGTNTTLGQSANPTTPQVSGFWLTPATPVQSTISNQAPMPVKWLYVLKGGQTIIPDSNTKGGNTVTFTGSSGAALSSTNPIIGRIAFWTDDESCKININTASESAPPVPPGSAAPVTGTYTGSFIDTPRVCTKYDESMAVYPAAQNEFQRYPGHPATVSLSTVFGSWANDKNYPECIYPLTPRVNNGGSKEGTVQYVTSYAATSNTSVPAIPLRPDRLYVTPDEFLFQPWSTATAPPRPLNSATNTEAALTVSPSSGLEYPSELDQPTVEKAKFFITASSRAPDVNLFNLPRVSMWPICATSGSLYRTAYDNLIAFCETTGTGPNGYPFYFQRQNWDSSTEYDTPQRNGTLLGYLRALYGMPIPGFSTGPSDTFANKYSVGAPTATPPAVTGTGTEIDQILMETFDYIRCVNLRDSSATVPGFKYYSNNGNGGTPGNPAPNDGIVVPSINTTAGTKGFGRFPTISSADVVFIASAGTAGTPIIKVPTNAPALSATNDVRVQAALIFSLFDPSQGFWGDFPYVYLQVDPTGLQWTIPAPPGGKATTSNIFSAGVMVTDPTNWDDCPPWGGEIGPRLFTGAYPFSGISYPFATQPPNAAGALCPDFPPGTFTFNGGTVKVSLYVAGGTTWTVKNPSIDSNQPKAIQTFTFTFPPASIPVPTLSSVALTSTDVFNPYYFNLTPQPNTNNVDSAAKYGRFYYYNNGDTPTPCLATIGMTDTVRGVECGSGDLRLVASLSDPSSLFTSLPSYSGTQQFSHNLVGPDGFIYYGAKRGTLITNGTSYWAGGPYTTGTGVNQPFAGNDILPNNISNNPTKFTFSCEPESTGTNTNGVLAGASSAPGDWDNGTGPVRDGPYINKADEGDIGTGYPGYSGGFYPAYFGYSYSASGANQRSALSAGSAYFSPARQMPSAGMLGSLPTGVLENLPWQTLLFHPDYTGNHKGGSANNTFPPDYLMLDFFHMPVVEPYAISEPLSTAGRINMNYLIVPFTYINRDTGVRSVLQSQQMLAIPSNTTVSGAYTTNQGAYSLAYKQQLSHQLSPNFIGSNNTASTYRFSINPDTTLQGFQARFNGSSPVAGSGGTGTPDIFRSASEICSLDLIPVDTGAAYGQMKAYWQTHALTGDNSRERPYANIYPLLTTKSNVYTIHFRVQTLKKINRPGAAFQPTWVEGTDVITGEYRGSQTIERYVDPNDPGLLLPGADYATQLVGASTMPAFSPSLPSLYKIRTVSTRQFAP